MLAVFLHQLHDNLRSMRFQVSLSILLLFFVANGVVYAMKIERMNSQFARVSTFDDDRYGRAESLGDLVDDWLIIRSPDVGVEFMAEAGSFWFAYARWVNAESGNTLWPRSSRTTNAWMRHFEVLDWTVIVRYVLSFLCIVLSYNAISGERESGSLRLALANPLSRAGFLAGKFLGHLATLAVALVAGTLLSLGVLALAGVLELDGVLARHYLLFLVSAGFYAALFLLLGVGVSAAARSSATALVLLLTSWTVVVVVVPQTSYLVAMLATDPIGPYADRIDDLQRDTRQRLEREGIAPRPAALARADGYALEKTYAAHLEELDGDMERMQRDVFRRRVEQYGVARTINLLSPGFAFQYAVEAFLGTGIHRYRSYDEQAWRYRAELRDFLRVRDAADPDSPHVLFLAAYMSSSPVDAADVPRFRERPVPFSAALAAGMAPLCILLLETTGALFFALAAFNRAEVSA